MSLAERHDFSLNSVYTGAPLIMNYVIFGYWMGPDEEDGCGYVEALIQRINWFCQVEKHNVRCFASDVLGDSLSVDGKT
jgi:hypothetical protein